MNTHITTKQQNLINKYALTLNIVKHPTKKQLILIDGNIDNLALSNLAWANRTTYMEGCHGLNLNASDGGFGNRTIAFQKKMPMLLRVGSIVPVITKGTYPEQTKPLPDTSNVNVSKLLGRRFK